jgi:hypothetical protein
MGGDLRRRDNPRGALGARSRSDDEHDVGQPLGEEYHHPPGLSPMDRDPVVDLVQRNGMTNVVNRDAERVAIPMPTTDDGRLLGRTKAQCRERIVHLLSPAP